MSKPTEYHSPKYFTVIVILLAATVGFLVTRQILVDSTSGHAIVADCPGTCVYLKADKAEPDTVTVKVGEFVQFNSADGRSHNLSLGLGGSEHEHKGQYSSGQFEADEAWRVQFKQPGSYTFHDHNNPNINVLVVAYQERQQPVNDF